MSVALSPTTVVTWYRNHFDLLWRRCWRRDYDYLGGRYRSYAGVQDEVLTRCLALAQEQGAAFVLEQSLSLRTYLEAHPESLAAFRSLAGAGRFELLGSGEAILDTNMCGTETLARNFASGIDWAERTLGVPVTFACSCDAFGTSAQLPQVVRGCGLRGGGEYSYSQPDNRYWRGLDGSAIMVIPGLAGQHHFYDHCYHEPCTCCRGQREVEGRPCAACEGTGFDLPQNWWPEREPVDCAGPWAECVLSSEEMLPDPALVSEVAARNAAQDRYRYVWGTPRRYFEEVYGEALAWADAPPADQLSSRVENNPTQTGTLVSRIRGKQAARAAEAALYPAEALVSLAEMLGAPRLAEAELQRAWLNLPLLFFHDAVTGTHIDPAHLELLDLAAEAVELSRSAAGRALAALGAEAAEPEPAEGFTVAVAQLQGQQGDHVVTVPLAEGAEGRHFSVRDAAGDEMPVYASPARPEPGVERIAPVGPDRRGSRRPEVTFLARGVPAGGCASFHLSPAEDAPAAVPLEGEAGNGLLRLAWDEHGPTLLEDQRLGQTVARAGELRLGELILEQDLGDAWGTRDLEHRARHPLGADTRCLGGRRWGAVQEVFFAGRMSNGTFGREPDPRVFGLWWYQTWKLYDDLPRVDLDLEVFWRSNDRRLRVAFPTGAESDRGLYSIPGGLLERDRYEMTETCLWSPNGDWPALYFAATLPAPGRPGLAVLNHGTPSARIEDGVLLYSILRSVGDPHCLSRYAQDYPMPTTELRDGGYHRFRFSLLSMPTEAVADGVMAEALRQNLPPVVSPVATPLEVAGPQVEPGAVQVEAVKRAFSGEGWAVRLVNYSSAPVTATVTLPRDGLTVQRGNLLERELAPVAVTGRSCAVELRGHEIATLVLREVR